MFAADDVIDLMRRVGIVFVKQAILAPMPCTLRNESPLRFAYLIRQAPCADAPAPSP